MNIIEEIFGKLEDFSIININKVERITTDNDDYFSNEYSTLTIRLFKTAYDYMDIEFYDNLVFFESFKTIKSKTIIIDNASYQVRTSRNVNFGVNNEYVQEFIMAIEDKFSVT